MNKLTDYRAVGLAEGFEQGTKEEIIEAWQHLHDTGLAYTLQGWFGRAASNLIEQGVIDE
jgi:Leu/Phe-tRNA-protein transferase